MCDPVCVLNFNGGVSDSLYRHYPGQFGWTIEQPLT